jgi:beta-galactosidase
MNWTDYKPGQNVQVWTYSNAPTVELFLNGQSLGAKSFDAKTSTDGVSYLETTECTNDDKQYTTGTCPGSYQSPNGSSGKLHLTWNVPFAPGRLVAVARDADGKEIARDEVDTAGEPYTLKLIPDKTVLLDDGKALSYIETQVVDKDGVMVPDANNTVKFDVTGAGTFAGADNGKQDDAEPYYPTTHDAFNGKVLAIVQAKTSTGPVHVTASSDGLVPASTTLYSSDQQGSALVAVRPVEVRSELGSAPALPATVTALHADNSTETLPVTWSPLPAAAAAHTGVYTLTGTVQGTQAPATATVTVYRHASIQSYSTAVAVGDAPMLPARVRLIDNDGVSRLVPVTWDAVDPSQYAAPGSFSVLGSVAGTPLKALATVRVTDQFQAAQNIAPLGRADASFTGWTNASNPPATILPATMLDGVTNANGWTNRYVEPATNILPSFSLSHASDWVSVSWPHPQHTGALTVFFTTNANNQLPAALTVSAWNGADWVPVSHQQVTWATASNAPTTITFDPVSTTKLKVDMVSASPKSATTGNFTIAELQATGNVVTLSSTAALSSLRVDGRPVPGFDPSTLSYTGVGADQVAPQITATAADNGTVTITPPLSLPGTATITVTSEDGSATRTYTVGLLPASIADGGVGGTVPATLALSLGAPASFGTFTPGLDHTYETSTSANVISTAGDATLSVLDPDTAHPGHLVNGSFFLPDALQAKATKADTTGTAYNAVSGSPLNLLSWAAPVSNDAVTLWFSQHIGRNDALRTGAYGKTLTFTLSTTQP